MDYFGSHTLVHVRGTLSFILIGGFVSISSKLRPGKRAEGRQDTYHSLIRNISVSFGIDAPKHSFPSPFTVVGGDSSAFAFSTTLFSLQRGDYASGPYTNVFNLADKSPHLTLFYAKNSYILSACCSSSGWSFYPASLLLRISCLHKNLPPPPPLPYHSLLMLALQPTI